MRHYMKNRILKSAAAALALLMGFSSPAAALTTYAAGSLNAAGSAYEQSVSTGASVKASSYEGVGAADDEFRSLIPSDQLYAVSGAFDPVFYASEYPDVVNALGADAATLKNHYETRGVFEGRKANADDTAAGPSKVTRIITLFLLQNRDYYLAHAGEDSFPYFSAAGYLAKYPEVKAQLISYLTAQGIVPASETNAAGLSEADYNKALANAATEHYLTYGALGGLSSCTTFDPVWAILAESSSYDYVNGSTPEEVLAAYKAVTGSSSTQGLPVGTDDVANVLNQHAGILILKKKTNGTTAGSNLSSSSGSAGDNGVNTESAPEQVVDVPLINALSAEKAEPAVLYSLADSSELSYGNFYLDTYNDIKGNASGKYTMMVFLCGSDLEDNGGTGSSSILNMLLSQYNSEEPINILVCVGGAKTWHADKLSANDNDGLSIYYLDSSKIKSEQMELIDTITKTAKEEYLKNGNTWSDRYVAYEVQARNKDLMNEIMNEGLVLLGDYGQRNMSESSILSGFMNLATNLFPADYYGLTFWDHGNGVSEGVCSSDMVTLNNGTTITGDMLEIAEIEKAFHDADLIKSGKTLDFLGFDACLMGGAETSLVLSGYYKYMLACEEIEAGDYGYNTLFKTLSSDLAGGNYSAAEFALQALKDFTACHTYKDDGSEIQSAAVFDAALVQSNAASMLNDVASDVTSLIDKSAAVDEDRNVNTASGNSLNTFLYQKLRKAAVRCYNAGTAAASTGAGRLSYIDILDYYQKLYEELNNCVITGDGPSDAEKAYNAQIIALQKTLKDVLTKGFLNAAEITYKGKEILISGKEYSNMDAALKILKNESLLASNCFFYGASIFMPTTANGRANREIVDNFYNGYKDSAELGEYAKLVKMMYDFETSDAETARIKALKGSIDYSKMVKEVTSDSTGMTIRFVTTYKKGAYKPAEGSSGDPMLDVTDTINTISLFATRNDERWYYMEYDQGEYYKGSDLRYHPLSNLVKDVQRFTYNADQDIYEQDNLGDYFYGTDGQYHLITTLTTDGKRYSYVSDKSADVIVAEQQIKLECLSGTNNAIVVSSDQMPSSFKGYTVKGVLINSQGTADNAPKDVTVLSDLENYSSKADAVQAATGYSSIISSNYLTVSGSAITCTETSDGNKAYQQQNTGIYHIFGYFGTDDNNNLVYKYVGTVQEKTKEDGTSLYYENLCNKDNGITVDRISAARMYVTKETTGEGKNAVTTYSEYSFDAVYDYQWLEIYYTDQGKLSNPSLTEISVDDYTKEGIVATAVGDATEKVLGLVLKTNTSASGNNAEKADADAKVLSESGTQETDGTVKNDVDTTEEEVPSDEETALNEPTDAVGAIPEAEENSAGIQEPETDETSM